MDSEWEWDMTAEESAYVEKIKFDHAKPEQDFHDVAETLIKLDRDGYAVVDCLGPVEVEYASTMLKEFVYTMPIDFYNHNQHPKRYKVNHSPASWYIRTRPSVLEFFQKSTRTKDLVSSFAGVRYWSGVKKKSWGHRGFHTDQSMFEKGFRGTCGYVALTDNVLSGFNIIKGSHKKHKTLALHRAMASKKNIGFWNNANHPEFSNTLPEPVFLKKGQMLLYDSRVAFTIIQSEEDIMGQYVSYFPRSDCSEEDLEVRKKAFSNQWTSTNIPTPFKQIKTSSDKVVETMNYFGFKGEVDKLV